MSKNSIFSDTFISNLTGVLEKQCESGNSVSSSVVCSELNLDANLKNIIGQAINLGLVPAFTTSQGRGIHKIDVSPVKGAKKLARIKRKPDVETTDDEAPTPTVKKSAKLTDEFMLQLRTVLEELCASSERPVPRKLVAETMGTPGTKTELLISEALKSEAFADFLIKAGRNGGIVFAAEVLQMAADDDNTMELPEDEVDLDTVLTTPEDDGEVLSELA